MSIQRLGMAFVFASGMVLGGSAIAQEFFELSAPDIRLASKAELSNQSLTIQDSNGGVTHYERDSQMDSEDREWLGYTSRAARQTIRWPRSNQGNMQIGTVGAGGRVQFRASRMTITSLNQVPNNPPPLENPNRPARRRERSDRDSILPRGDGDHRERDMEGFDDIMNIRLSHQADDDHFLSFANGKLSLVRAAVNAASDWMMVPVGHGLVRFQMQQGNQWFALGCHPQRRQPFVGPINGDPSQLWRWSLFPAAGGGYLMESVMFPGQALAFQGGQLLLQPIGFSPAQQWFPVLQPPLQLDPIYRTVTANVTPNPPLEPARVQLTNTHQDALFVLLADRRANGSVQTIRIPPGDSAFVELDRDSGATLTETYEVYLPNGTWDRQVNRIPIPPSILYDISVYTEFLQSIAIDRTGKNPNPIEDVNYQPKSLGFFLVPPGNGISPDEVMDVYTNGMNAKNPGAVRRIDHELLEKKKLPTEDPLKKLLKEFQSQRAAF